MNQYVQTEIPYTDKERRKQLLFKLVDDITHGVSTQGQVSNEEPHPGDTKLIKALEQSELEKIDLVDEKEEMR